MAENETENSKASNGSHKNLKYFILALIGFFGYCLLMEKVVKSSVLLVKPGLLIGNMLLLVLLIAYIFLETSIVSLVCVCLLVLNCIYMFIMRNKVYKVYIRSMSNKADKDKFMKLFKAKSAVIMVYEGDGKGATYVYKNMKQEPMKTFISSKNLVKDNFKLQVSIKFQPFGSPTGIVKRALVLVPIKPSPEDIKKYKIIVIGGQ